MRIYPRDTGAASPGAPNRDSLSILRGDEVLMAHHDTEIAEGDHVILFLTDRRHVEAVEKLFQAGVSYL